VRVAVGKLAGVESVDVSLERAVADIRLRPGNAVTLAQLRRIIKDNGFTSKAATVTVVGTLSDRGGSPVLVVTGTDAVLWLARDPKSPDAFAKVENRLRMHPEQPVDLRGTVESVPNQRERLIVSGVTHRDQGGTGGPTEAATGRQRYDNGAVLQYSGIPGILEGTRRRDGVITLPWGGTSDGSRTARATLTGGSLAVQDNLLMQMTDFEAAVYVLRL
jgi:hypothetical protein